MLGLSGDPPGSGGYEDGLWLLTPRDYVALLRKYEEQQEREDWRAGVIASTVANCAPFVKRKKTLTPEDFMPGRRRKAQAPPDEVVHAKILSAFKGLGAKDKRGAPSQS